MKLSIITGVIVFLIAAALLTTFRTIRAKRAANRAAADTDEPPAKTKILWSFGYPALFAVIAVGITRWIENATWWHSVLAWVLVGIALTVILTYAAVRSDRVGIRRFKTWVEAHEWRYHKEGGALVFSVLAVLASLAVPFRAAQADDDGDEEAEQEVAKNLASADTNGDGEVNTDELRMYFGTGCEQLGNDADFIRNYPGPAVGVTSQALPQDPTEVAMAIFNQVAQHPLVQAYWSTLNAGFILGSSDPQAGIDYETVANAWLADPADRMATCKRLSTELTAGLVAHGVVADAADTQQFSLLVYKNEYTTAGWVCKQTPPPEGLHVVTWPIVGDESDDANVATASVALELNAIFTTECIGEVIEEPIEVPTSTPDTTPAADPTQAPAPETAPPTAQPPTAQPPAAAPPAETPAGPTGPGQAPSPGGGSAGGEPGGGPAHCTDVPSPTCPGPGPGGGGGVDDCADTDSCPGDGGGDDCTEGCGEGPTTTGAPGCNGCNTPTTTRPPTPTTVPKTTVVTTVPQTTVVVTTVPITTVPQTTAPTTTLPTTTTAPCPPGYTRLPDGSCKSPDTGIPDV